MSCSRHLYSLITSTSFHPFYKSPQILYYDRSKHIISQIIHSKLAHCIHFIDYKTSNYCNEENPDTTTVLPSKSFKQLSKLLCLKSLKCILQFPKLTTQYNSSYVFTSLKHTLKELCIKMDLSSVG
jgi:hypothetical protein